LTIWRITCTIGLVKVAKLGIKTKIGQYSLVSLRK